MLKILLTFAPIVTFIDTLIEFAYKMLYILIEFIKGIIERFL